jgi:protein SCO1
MDAGDRARPWRSSLGRFGGGRRALVIVSLVLSACGPNGAAEPRSSPTAGPSLIGSPAPDFSLIDQFGHPERLSEFRGKVVLLTFVSSRCTKICPLTAQLLTRTQDLLGSAASETQLIAVNANFVYRSVQDVLRWSRLHGMTDRWLFVTGPVRSLEPVYEAYGVTPGSAHSVVVYVVDASGRVETEVPVAGQKGIGAEARAIARYVGNLTTA